MKILNYSLVLVASFAFLSSCSNNDDEAVVNNEVKVEKTFTVGSSTSSDSRARIYEFNENNSGQSILWEQFDKITVFAIGHSNGDAFSIDRIDGLANKASFTGFTYNASEYWALYPAQNDAMLRNDGYLQFTIPNEQRALTNTFDPDAGIQIGHLIGSGDFNLKNVCAFFVLNLEKDCEYFTISSLKSNWWLAGTVYAEARSGSSAIQGFVEGKCQSEITLKDIPENGGRFFIAFIPSDQHPGVVVTTKFKDSTAKYYEFKPKSSGGSISFSAGYIYDMGTFGSSTHTPK